MTTTTTTSNSVLSFLPGALLYFAYISSRSDAFTIVSPLTTSTLPPSTRTISCPLPVSPPRTRSTSSLHGFFGLGGSSVDPKDKIDAVLGSYDINVGNTNVDVAFNSLSDYIQNKWVRLFDNDTIKLTTPVLVEKFEATAPEDGVDIVSGVRFLFQKRKTGYTSKKDEVQAEQDKESQKDQDKKKKKDDEPKEGGVEILVEQLTGGNKIRVRAKRCEVDESTVIKEMSEETILAELKTAIEVWKKDIRS